MLGRLTRLGRRVHFVVSHVILSTGLFLVVCRFSLIDEEVALRDTVLSGGGTKLTLGSEAELVEQRCFGSFPLSSFFLQQLMETRDFLLLSRYLAL